MAVSPPDCLRLRGDAVRDSDGQDVERGSDVEDFC